MYHLGRRERARARRRAGRVLADARRRCPNSTGGSAASCTARPLARSCARQSVACDLCNCCAENHYIKYSESEAQAMASEEGHPVLLYIYDLSHGLASLLSPAILGRSVEGVWHTSLVVYEREFFYGSGGITSCAPGGTQLGEPNEVQRLGETFVPFQVFVDYMQGLAATAYSGAQYRLLEHNCNHFTDEVAQFLCGARCPKHVLAQPDEALPPPLRRALEALLAGVLPDAGQAVYADGVRTSRRDSPDYLTLNSQIEEARVQGAELEQRRSTLAEKVARKERRREKRRRRAAAAGEEDDAPEMAEAAEPVSFEAGAAALEAGASEASSGSAGPSAGLRDAEARRAEELRRRALDPPIVYQDIDGAAELEQLTAALGGAALGEAERRSLDELRQYLVGGEGSWVLGDDFLAFVGRLLSADEGALGSERRCRTLRCLAAAALREDVALLLHQDRRDHALLNYAARIDRLPPDEQRALALFMCNLFAHLSASEWLLYISEWELDGQPLSNIRVTTKVAVHAALSEDAALRELGTALMHNIAAKEVKTVRLRAGGALRGLLPRNAKTKVFDEVCVELAMALLQVLAGAPGEEHLYRAVKALARLAHHSHEVPQLVAVVGPDPAAFRGTSPRVDEQIDLIMVKVK